MFENIGGKIKALAKVICWIGIISSIIATIAIWATGDRWNPTFFPGLITLVAGCLGSWLGSFFTYGFGELIEETTTNRKAIDKNNELLSQLLKANAASADNPKEKRTQSTENQKHRWTCPDCGKLISETPCPHCKEKTIAKTASVYATAADHTNQNFTGSSCKPTVINDSEIKCLFCGTLQKADRNVCFECGAKFIR